MGSWVASNYVSETPPKLSLEAPNNFDKRQQQTDAVRITTKSGRPVHLKIQERSGTVFPRQVVCSVVQHLNS
jgi:hypothetical protein